MAFQHTAARRRLQGMAADKAEDEGFQHTAARRRLHEVVKGMAADKAVSTHSRAEAAAMKS